MAKKKSLMDALSEYQQEKSEFGRAQVKEEREKKMAKKASKTKSNTKTAFSTKQLLKTDKVKEGATHRRSPSAPPPVKSKGSSGGGSRSSGGGTSKPKSTSGSSSGSSKSSSQSNKDGTYGKSMPSNPKVGTTMKPRRARPGTGRRGAAEAKRATRMQGKPKSEHKETMTAAKRRAMRLRARRGR